jgi:hypothetical protein
MQEFSETIYLKVWLVELTVKYSPFETVEHLARSMRGLRSPAAAGYLVTKLSLWENEHLKQCLN